MKYKALKSTVDDFTITKNMLKVVRGYNTVTEAINSAPIIPKETDEIYKEESEKLRTSVDPRLVITKFNIYPNDRNVELDGRLDSGINFYMSVKAMKLSLSITDNEGKPIRVFIDNELLDTIKKLYGYYENWAREWADKITTEYRSEQ